MAIILAAPQSPQLLKQSKDTPRVSIPPLTALNAALATDVPLCRCPPFLHGEDYAQRLQDQETEMEFEVGGPWWSWQQDEI
jgi:hypothetical protein